MFKSEKKTFSNRVMVIIMVLKFQGPTGPILTCDITQYMAILCNIVQYCQISNNIGHICQHTIYQQVALMSKPIAFI